eukprot:1279617-Rhodomonas_salina.1
MVWGVPVELADDLQVDVAKNSSLIRLKEQVADLREQMARQQLSPPKVSPPKGLLKKRKSVCFKDDRNELFLYTDDDNDALSSTSTCSGSQRLVCEGRESADHEITGRD